MKNVIYSKVAGMMIQDTIFNHWWKGEKINVPFFDNKEIRVIYVNEISNKMNNFIVDADNELDLFLNMNSSNQLLILNIVQEHYTDYQKS